MCMGCFTGAEAVVTQGAVGVAFARSEFTRWHEQLTGRDPIERKRAAHEANAEFLASLGLDPDRVLGPPPAGDGA